MKVWLDYRNYHLRLQALASRCRWLFQQGEHETELEFTKPMQNKVEGYKEKTDVV